jgi:hypothetical protein
MTDMATFIELGPDTGSACSKAVPALMGSAAFLNKAGTALLRLSGLRLK